MRRRFTVQPILAAQIGSYNGYPICLEDDYQGDQRYYSIVDGEVVYAELQEELEAKIESMISKH